MKVTQYKDHPKTKQEARYRGKRLAAFLKAKTKADWSVNVWEEIDDWWMYEAVRGTIVVREHSGISAYRFSFTNTIFNRGIAVNGKESLLREIKNSLLVTRHSLVTLIEAINTNKGIFKFNPIVIQAP